MKSGRRTFRRGPAAPFFPRPLHFPLLHFCETQVLSYAKSDEADMVMSRLSIPTPLPSSSERYHAHTEK